jgi:DNA polymerase III delta subunit
MDIVYGEDAYLVYEAVKKNTAELTRIYLEGDFSWDTLSDDKDGFFFEQPAYLCYVLKTPQKKDIEALKKFAALKENPIRLLVFPEIHFKDTKSAWFSEIIKLGTPKKITSPRGAALKSFFAEKGHEFGIKLDDETLSFLSEFFAGRAGEALQALEVSALSENSASWQDSSFIPADIFALERFCRAKNHGKAIQTLEQLEMEGVEPARVLWALARGFPWPQEMPARHFQLAKIDWMIKGLYPGNPWVAMRWLLLHDKEDHGTLF